MSVTLVTGGAGYVGAHTVHQLIHEGVPAHEIIVFDDLSTGHEHHLPAGVELIQGDLTSANDIKKVFQKRPIHRVLHFAGAAYVGESMADPGKYFRINVLGGINLLEEMQRAGCRQIVFSSSCTTYGLPKALPIDEDHRQEPINPYGESKLMMERALRWYATAHGVRSVVLRYFNAAGAGYGIGEAHDPETHLIPLAIRAALNLGPALSIFGTDYDTPDGTCIRDYVHVLDLANAHTIALSFLEGSTASFTALNLGTGRGTSVQEVVDIVADVAVRPVPLVRSKRRSGDPSVLVADATLAGSVLRWRAERDIRGIVRDAWNWHAARCDVSSQR